MTDFDEVPESYGGPLLIPTLKAGEEAKLLSTEDLARALTEPGLTFGESELWVRKVIREGLIHPAREARRGPHGRLYWTVETALIAKVMQTIARTIGIADADLLRVVSNCLTVWGSDLKEKHGSDALADNPAAQVWLTAVGFSTAWALDIGVFVDESTGETVKVANLNEGTTGFATEWENPEGFTARGLVTISLTPLLECCYGEKQVAH